MNTMKEEALKYARRGWAIFPCRGDKSPYTDHGFQDATTDEKQLEDWWDEWPMANIGWCPADNDMVVVDVDAYKPGFSWDNAACELPHTNLRSTSARGGAHLIYALGEGEVASSDSTGKLGKHFDCKSFGGYILLPPSKFQGGTYTWESEGQPAYRTDEMLRLCNAGRGKHDDRDTWLIKPDMNDNIALANEWLKNDAKVAVEGYGGDAMAFKTAAHMKSFGISKELAFDLMWEHWNPRCSPPWGAAEADHLQTKVDNGYEYNTSPPGNITPAYKIAKNAELFKPVVSELAAGHEWKAGRFRFVDRPGMQGIQPPEWLIEGFLPAEGYSILFGAPGTCKTFIALDIALSIATGFGMGPDATWPDIAKSGAVLFAAGEGRANLTSRVAGWEQTHLAGGMAENFILGDPVPMISEDVQPFIDGALEARPQGYKLVVIDTVGRAMQGANENAQEHASAFTHMVETIQKSLGCAVMALHHTGKGDSGQARGSSVFGADADTMIHLSRNGKDMVVSLRMAKQKDAVEWADDVLVALKEVEVFEGHTTLVAGKARLEDVPEKKEISKSGRELMKDHVEGVIEDALLRVLEANKIRAFSERALAIAIMSEKDVEIRETRIKSYMKGFIADSKCRANACYDGGAAKWRWAG